MTISHHDHDPETPVTPAPLSAYVDYTPRRTFVASKPDKGFHQLDGCSRQRRAFYFHQLAQQENDTDDYMDSPAVRRYHGVNVEVAPIEPDIEHTQSSLDRTKEWSTKDFDVGKHLGSGRFGSVYIAREKTSQQIVALKIVKKDEIEKARVVPFLKREIEIHGHLRHPNILRLYGYFHDGDHVYIVLEYASQGELYERLRNEGPLPEDVAAKYVAQIVRALRYLHGLHVIHRDIKPENVLISANGVLKLADFGWAVHDRRPRRNTFCGTLDYLPPEMIENKPHDEKVDIWAIGVLSYELLVGKPPFEDLNGYVETYNKILKLKYRFPSNVSMNAQHFISRILQHNPRKRPRLTDIENHPWIKPYMQ